MWGLCYRFVLKTVLIEETKAFRNGFVIAEQTLHSQDLFYSSYSLPSKESGGAQGAGWAYSQERPQLTQGIFHTVWCHAEYIKSAEHLSVYGKGRNLMFCFCLCIQLLFYPLSCLYLNQSFPHPSGSCIQNAVLNPGLNRDRIKGSIGKGSKDDWTCAKKLKSCIKRKR